MSAPARKRSAGGEEGVEGFERPGAAESGSCKKGRPSKVSSDLLAVELKDNEHLREYCDCWLALARGHRDRAVGLKRMRLLCNCIDL